MRDCPALWTECLCPPENSCVEALTSNVAEFEDEASEQVIKIKWGHKGRALIW